MMICGMSKKTLAVLLCISSISVMLILSSQLKSPTRHQLRYDDAQQAALSVPLIVDISKNVTFLKLQDAQNRIHQYKLVRLNDGEDDQEEEEEIAKRHQLQVQKQVERNIDDALEKEEQKDAFGDDEESESSSSSPLDSSTSKSQPPPAPVIPNFKEQISMPNITVRAKPAKKRANYLTRVADPRAPRMIGKVLSRLPADVRKPMTAAIRKLESVTGKTFQTLPTTRQWELILSVFKTNGYEQRLPDVINIGVKKSGTNALGFFLTQHPQIVHSIGNEVHYFDWKYKEGIDYYLSRMGFAKPGQLEFEKTPRYFVTHDAPLKIRRDLPTNPKFILCVRDPLARLMSDFRHESELKLRREFKHNRSKFASRTPESEGNRLRDLILDDMGRVNASNELIDTSVYLKHYQNWLKYFPPEQILILDHEQLERDAYTEMKRVEQFLGLKPYFSSRMFYFDDQRHGTCMYNIPRNCPAKSTPGVLPKAKVDTDTLKKLKEFYTPFNQEFARLVDMDFSWAK